MTKFVAAATEEIDGGTIGFGGYTAAAAKPRRFRKVLLMTAAVIAIVALSAGIGGWLYWRSFRDTPQYSLALLVDAARQNDQATIDRIVDTDELVDNFVPQITSKAVELYGRGQPPETIARARQIAEPLMPAIKDRARAELPRVIRRKTAEFENVPFGAMVVGAERYLVIDRRDENTAFVRSKSPEHSFEVEMRREGDAWKVVGVRDDQLATSIAKAVGQEIVAIAARRGTGASRNSLGVRNLGDILRQAEEIFK